MKKIIYPLLVAFTFFGFATLIGSVDRCSDGLVTDGVDLIDKAVNLKEDSLKNVKDSILMESDISPFSSDSLILDSSVIGNLFDVPFMESKRVVSEKPKAVFVSKITDWTTHTPYKDFRGWVEYFNKPAKEIGKRHGIPYELILSKAWLETKAGREGVGKEGNLYAIKGKGKIWAKDDHTHKSNFKSYPSRWHSVNDFAHMISQRVPMYRERYEAWKQVLKGKEDYYYWALALQVHPDLEKSRSAYASTHCMDGTKNKCYKSRKLHGMKNIYYIRKYIYNHSDITLNRSIE